MKGIRITDVGRLRNALAEGVTAARWIDVGAVEPVAFHATYAGVAEARVPGAPPAVVWGRPGPHVCLGQNQGRCEVDDAVAVPVVRRPLGGGTVWVDDDQLCYAIVAPRELAPRRPADWYGWALAPAIATFRSFGLPAALHGEDLWLGGRKIAGSGAATIGCSAVVASSFLLRFPRERFAAAVAAPSPGFRAALGPALAATMTDWASHATPPAPDAIARALQDALCALFGWSTLEARLGDAEEKAIAAWRDELAAPIEIGRRRVAGGLKLNAAFELVCDPRSGTTGPRRVAS